MGGWRAANNDRSKKVGVAASDFDDFRRKACAKLDKNYDTSKFYIAECGTLVGDADYFNTVKQHTLFIVIDDDEVIENDVEIQFKKRRPADYAAISKQVQRLFIEHPEQMRHLISLVKSEASPDKVHLSKRDEHEDWFIGADKFNTKEEFMRHKAATRMKSYLRRAKSPVNKTDEYLDRNRPTHRKIQEFWKRLADALKREDYHADYFDRLVGDDRKFCDALGNFSCQGRWNEDECGDTEAVNPYASRSERTIFKSWNFDHKIELSRAIVPSIIEGIKAINGGKIKCRSCNRISDDGHLSADSYYRLLFTRNNLKLVSEICHDKKKHGTLDEVYVVCVKCVDCPTPQ